MGITDAKLKELSKYKESALFSTQEKTVLKYTDEMTSTPVLVSDSVFDELNEFFNDSQIVELTSAIAWENYRARFDHALQVESQGFSGDEYCPLPVT